MREKLMKSAHDRLERLRDNFFKNGGYESVELQNVVEMLSQPNIDIQQTRAYLLLADAKLKELTARHNRLSIEYSNLEGHYNSLAAQQRAEKMNDISATGREERIMGAIVDALENAIGPV